MIGRAPGLTGPIVVIIVDEDAAVRAALKFAFEIEGYAVRTYGSGNELFGDAGLADCACFVIDQQLPGMRGLDVVAALRQQHIAAPAILITSAPPKVVQERAARAGIPIVEKPLLSNALLDHVRAVTTRPPRPH